MDREMFNKLPYEKQSELEKWALRSMLLEFSFKELDNGNRAYYEVRIMYRDPSGDELRYYPDNWSVIQDCYKHLFAYMQFSGHTSKYGSGSFDVSYDNIYWAIDLERAKQIYTTLKWLEKRIEATASELFEHGSHDTFAEYMTSCSLALGAVGGLIRNGDLREEMSIGEFLERIKEIEQGFTVKYKEMAESEAVNA